MKWPCAERASCALALVSAAMLVACSGSPESATQTATDNRPAYDTVAVNFSINLPWAPLMLALDEGFFEEERIRIEPAWLGVGEAQVALAGLKLDVFSTAMRASVFSMIERGMPMRLVAGKGQKSEGCSAETFVAPTEMAERIIAAGGSPRGERVAVVRGGNQEFLLARLLAQHQLTFDDVIAFPLRHGTSGSSSDLIEAFRYVGEPNLSVLLSEGGTRIVTTADKIAPHQTAILVYGKRMLYDDPDLGERFMRAYVRGLRALDEGATERNVVILSRHTKLSPEVIRNICWTTTPNDGYIDPEDVQPFLDWAHSVGYLDGPMTVDWWDPTILDAAINSLASDAE